MSQTATIDGQPFAIEPGETIFEFVERHKIKGTIPTLCYDELLEPFGSCRVCSVEVARAPDGPRRVVASCHTPVEADTHIFNNTKRIQRLRRNIMELVLTDYPVQALQAGPNGAGGEPRTDSLARPVSPGLREHYEQLDSASAVCSDAAAGQQQKGGQPAITSARHLGGDAELFNVLRQVQFDPATIRYAPGRNHQDRAPDTSHAYMRADLSKCINCYRCVRACDEIQGQQVLNMFGRGFDNRIIMGADTDFANSPCVSCGACSQTCPTGAITDIYRPLIKEATRTERTICSYCGVGCNLDVHVQGDHDILAITAPKTAAANVGHTCLKGRYAFRFQSHPDRLRTPLIKRDGAFTPATWDEAYDYVTEKLSTIRDTHGPDAVAGISSARCTNEENYLMQKFIRAVIGTNNIDCCARVCHSPTALGMQMTYGTGAATNSIQCLDQTDLIMIIGANPTSAHPVTGARIRQKLMKGTPLILLDPIETEISAYASHHLRLRPGTNMAVLNMMAHYIIMEGLVDREFVDARCEGFDEFERKLRALDIDRMEEVSGVDRDLVRAAAIAYATAPNAMCFHGLGVTEHSQGTRTVTLIAALAMMTGNLGREGVGVNPLRGQNNVQGAADMGAQPHQGAGYLDVTQPEVHDTYAEAYGIDVPTAIGYKIPEMFDAAIDGKLKALWLMGEDVVQTDPNSSHVIKAMESLELLVVQEIFMTETAKLADVVFPATTFLEKSGTFTNGERRIQRCNQVVPPLEGTKTDGQIMIDVMNRMGYAQKGPEPDVLLEEISQVVPFFAGVTWENLGEDGLQWPVKEGGIDTQIMHKETFKHGRGRFFYFDWEESAELVSNADEYPFVLTTGRKLEHYNCGTMTRRTLNLEILGEDVLVIHPKDAKRKKIDEGTPVRLFSKRGEVTLRANLSRVVKPGILYTTFHFPEQLVNYVTSDVADRETLCPEYKVVAVDIEPGRGRA